MNDAERFLVERLSDAVLALMAHVELESQGLRWEEISQLKAWRMGNDAVKLKWKMFPPTNEPRHAASCLSWRKLPCNCRETPPKVAR